MSNSDFGRGYATCLLQFVNHRARLDEHLESYRHMSTTHPDLFDVPSAIEMWANGASDHLYELKRPRRNVPLAEWERARALAVRALDIGHGFQRPLTGTEAEARRLLCEAERLLDALVMRGYAVGTLDEAMATDHDLGLRPEQGSWSCAENLDRRAVPA